MNYHNFAARLSPRPPRPAAEKKLRAAVVPRRKPAPSHRKLAGPVAAAGLLLLGTLAAPAAQLTPNIDFLFYPFAGTPGTRTTAYNFGAVGSDGFDNRDAQIFIQFDTSTIAPTGLSLSAYQVTSATLTLTYAGASNLVYDGTYDPFLTYTTGTDLDAGRPVELYGAGYRNGYTSQSVSESMAFTTQSSSTTYDHIRNVFATDYQGGTSRDVSNNVSDAFDPGPFAVGQVAAADLTGGLVNKNANITFTLNLNNLDVLHYLQMSLAAGRLGLVTSSLQAASQGGSATYPLFYTKENAVDLPPTLSLQVQVVPEPNAMTMFLCAVGLFAATWRGGQVFKARRGGMDV